MKNDYWYDHHEEDGYQGNGKAMFAMLALILLGILLGSYLVSLA